MPRWRSWDASSAMTSRGLLSPGTGGGTPRLSKTVCAFLTGSGLSLNARKRQIYRQKYKGSCDD